MALQGSIETFALADVLRLLASTSKTGRLRLSGTRGSGSLWAVEGKLVGGDVSTATTATPTDVLFELLRFPDGDFSFDQDELAPEVGAPVEVETALTDAEAMLAEWQELEAVVPSLDAWVSLRAELSADSITLDAAQWKAVVAVEGGRRVGDYAAATELGELAVMRQVRDLVELGVAEVGDAPADAPEAPVAEPSVPEVDDVVAPPAESTDDVATESAEATDEGEGLAAFGGVDEVVEGAESESFESFDPDGLVVEDSWSVDESPSDTLAEEDTLVEASDDAAAGADLDGGAEPEMDAADIARQLATLSPAAARAVAAAAKASTPEEREEALAGIPEEEGSLNRDLLLKFLGSVNS
ncbi:MAG: DUF4388 domain-containing protein [Acidimicrobiia bacterium]|nr:DUF4388 domain-containing protein [Acidimicrobiia bacterium]